MAYVKNTWVDREGQTRYHETIDDDGALIFTPDYEKVTEIGTPVNADNMNHIEEGIDDHENRIAVLENAGSEHYVKKTGDTMTGSLHFSMNGTAFKGVESNSSTYELGVTPSTESRGIRIASFDKNGEYVTAAQARYKADGWNVWNILARNFVDGVPNLAKLSIQANNTGYSGLWFNEKQMLYVEDFYVNGASFYMIFNKRAGQTKRWCIQGGFATGGSNSSGATISFLKPFYDVGYSLTFGASYDYTSTGVAGINACERNTDSFKVITSRSAGSAVGFLAFTFSWLAMGYLADGE